MVNETTTEALPIAPGRGNRRELVGVVTSDKMDKTVVVQVDWKSRVPMYGKLQRRVTRLYAHDNKGECKLGDTVRVEETRPISHLKHWRVVEIVARHQVAEVQPSEIDQVAP